MKNSVGLSLIFIIIAVVLLVSISDLQAQNVHIQEQNLLIQEQNQGLQAELAAVRQQLILTQQQAEEDRKRQKVEQWVTTFVGTVAGWLLGLIAPGQLTPSSVWIHIRGRFSDVIKSIQEELDRRESLPVLEQTQASSMTVYRPNTSKRNFSQSIQSPSNKLFTNLCPKCGEPMEKQMATRGEHNGKIFFVCTNYQRCRYVQPIE